MAVAKRDPSSDTKMNKRKKGKGNDKNIESMSNKVKEDSVTKNKNDSKDSKKNDNNKEANKDRIQQAQGDLKSKKKDKEVKNDKGEGSGEKESVMVEDHFLDRKDVGEATLALLKDHAEKQKQQPPPADNDDDDEEKQVTSKKSNDGSKRRRLSSDAKTNNAATPIFVQFGLHAPEGHQPQFKPRRITIPHPLFKTYQREKDAEGVGKEEGDVDDYLECPTVCVIVVDGFAKFVHQAIQTHSKELKCVKNVLTVSRLSVKTPLEREELTDQHTVLMVDDRVMRRVYKMLGPDMMGSTTKALIPVPIKRKGAISYNIQSALRATYVRILKGAPVSIEVGNTGMPQSKIVDNVLSVVSKVSPILPQNTNRMNIRSIGIKTATSTHIMFYSKTPEELEDIAKEAGVALRKHLPSKESNDDDDDDDDEEEEGSRQKRKGGSSESSKTSKKQMVEKQEEKKDSAQKKKNRVDDDSGDVKESKKSKQKKRKNSIEEENTPPKKDGKGKDSPKERIKEEEVSEEDDSANQEREGLGKNGNKAKKGKAEDKADLKRSDKKEEGDASGNDKLKEMAPMENGNKRGSNKKRHSTGQPASKSGSRGRKRSQSLGRN